MYYVKLFNKENQCILNAPFDKKNSAIEYFNTKADRRTYFDIYPFIEYDRIELLNDNAVLFDCEVH